MYSFMQDETMVPFMYVSPLLILLFLLIKSQFFNKPTTKKNLPPSPPKLPLIGNLHQLSPLLHHSLRSLSQRHGGPLMLLHLGSVPTIVVSSAAAASEIMKTQDLIFANRPDLRLWRRLLYNNKEITVAPYGEYWRQAKSITVLHLLSSKRVQAQRAVREEEMTILERKIKKSCDNQVAVDLSDLFVTFTNDVVCRLTFGRKYSEGESGRKFKMMLGEHFALLGGLSLEDCVPQLAWVDRLRGLDGRVDRLARDVDEFLEGVVEARLKGLTGGGCREVFVDMLLKIQKDDSIGVFLDRVAIKALLLGVVEGVVEARLKGLTGGGCREVFVDILLKIQKDDSIGVFLDRVAIKALLLDAYTAGTDTTATVLEWAFTELLKHPRVFKKTQNEVRAILKGKQHINQEDVNNMKYLKAVIKETLRLHPPIPTLVPRVANEDAKVMGYDVPKGTRVIINAWAIARDPKAWDEPEEFRPERFLDCTVDFKGHDFDLIPFGAGRRGCPGITFAMTTNENLLASLLHKFNWALPNGANAEDLDMNERPGLTIRKKLPLLAVATPFSS